ncbi:MAG: hypothetical protein H7844_10290 [Nitrospirae bacterium YQR-1]
MNSAGNPRFYMYFLPLCLALSAYGYFLITNKLGEELILYYNYTKFPFYHWFYNAWGLGNGFYRPLQIVFNYPLMQFLEITGFRYGYLYNFVYILVIAIIYAKFLKEITPEDNLLVVLLTGILITGKPFVTSFVFLTDNASLLLSLFFICITYISYVKNNPSALVVKLLVIASPFLKESGLVIIPYYIFLVMHLKYDFNLRKFLTDKTFLFFIFYFFIFLLIRKFAVEHSGLKAASEIGMFPLVQYGISNAALNGFINVVVAILNILNLEIIYTPFFYYEMEVTINTYLRLALIGSLWIYIYIIIIKHMTKDIFLKIFPLLILILFNGMMSYSGVSDRMYVSGFSGLVVLIGFYCSHIVRKNIFKVILILILVYQTYICIRSSHKYYHDSIHYNPVFEYFLTEEDIRKAILRATGDRQTEAFMKHFKTLYPVAE